MLSILRRLTLATLLGWAGWVAWHYRLVDAGGLTSPSKVEGMIFGEAFLLAAMTGGVVAWLCQNPTRPVRIFVALIALVGVGFVVDRNAVRIFTGVPDFVRILTIMLGGAGIGAGFELKLRRAPFRRECLALFLVLPFALLSGIADRGVTLLSLIITLAAAAGLGRTLQEKLVPALSVDAATLGIATSMRLALGMVTLGLMAFVLGLVHLAYPAILLSAAIAAIVATRGALGRECAPLRHWLTTPALASRSGGWITGITWSILLIAWIAALAPEVGPDALGGRQAIVKLWAGDHALATYREMTLSYMAAGAETFYLALFPLAGVQAAKIGQFIAVLSLLPALGGFTRCRTATARLLLLAFGASSLVFTQFSWGFVDLVQTLYYVTALATGWLWLQQKHRGLLFLAAVLAASAAAVKLNGLGAVVILGAVVVAGRLRAPRAWRELALDTLTVAAGAGLILGPWLLRSYLFSGNPIFPYANGFFASPLAPLELIAKRFGDPLSLATLVKLPWLVFFDPGHYVELGTYHPLLLATLPLLLVAAFFRSSRYWILTGLAAVALWGITEQNLRYTLFAGLLLVCGTAHWLDQWLAARPPLGRGLAAVAACVLFFGGTYAQLARPSSWLFRGTDGASLPLAVVLNKVSRYDYLRVQLPHVALLKQVDQTSGSHAVVWEVPWLRDHLHLAGHAIAMPHCDYRLAAKLRTLLDFAPSPQNLQQIHTALAELGITHLILPPDSTWSPTSPDHPPNAIFSDSFPESVAQLEGANGGYVLLSLRPKFIEHQPNIWGPNLFANSTFQQRQPDQPPANWAPSSSVDNSYAPPLALPAGFGLGQLVAVQPGQLYRLELKLPPETPPGPGAQLRTAWRDSKGKLLLYYTFGIEVKVTAGVVTHYQTAPDTAQSVHLEVVGPLTLTDISLQAVTPGP